jgi:hypothetical protein
MTIKLINAPGSTGRGSIVGMDDSRLGVFSEKIGAFQVGKTYEIEYTETERNGKMLRNVKSAKEVASAAAKETFVSGAYRPNGGGSAPAAAAPFRSPEQLFVETLIGHGLTSGAVKWDKQRNADASGPLAAYVRLRFRPSAFGSSGVKK